MFMLSWVLIPDGVFRQRPNESNVQRGSIKNRYNRNYESLEI